MMQARPTSKTFVKPTVSVGLIVVLALLIYGALSHSKHWWPFHTVSQTSSVTNQQTDHPSPKNNNTPSKAASPSDTSSETSNQVPVDSSLSASITKLEEANGQVSFSATVQHTSSAGTCVVTFSNPNDRPVTKQFDASYSSNASTCGPIAFSANEFSYIGNWQVNFHYYTGDKQATAQGNINIQ